MRNPFESVQVGERVEVRVEGAAELVTGTYQGIAPDGQHQVVDSRLTHSLHPSDVRQVVVVSSTAGPE